MLTLLFNQSAPASAAATGLASAEALGTELAIGGARGVVVGLSSTAVEGIETALGGATKAVLGQASASVLASVAVLGGAKGTVSGITSNSIEGIESALGGASPFVLGIQTSEALASVSAFGTAVAPVTGQESSEAFGFGQVVAPPVLSQGGGGYERRARDEKKPEITRRGRAIVRGLTSESELGEVTAHGERNPPAFEIIAAATFDEPSPIEPAVIGHIAAESGDPWTEEEELIALLMFEAAA